MNVLVRADIPRARSVVVSVERTRNAGTVIRRPVRAAGIDARRIGGKTPAGQQKRIGRDVPRSIRRQRRGAQMVGLITEARAGQIIGAASVLDDDRIHQDSLTHTVDSSSAAVADHRAVANPSANRLKSNPATGGCCRIADNHAVLHDITAPHIHAATGGCLVVANQAANKAAVSLRADTAAESAGVVGEYRIIHRATLRAVETAAVKP